MNVNKVLYIAVGLIREAMKANPTELGLRDFREESERAIEQFNDDGLTGNGTEQDVADWEATIASITE
jgi:hypothetical protein